MKPFVRLAVAVILAAPPSSELGQDEFFDSNGVRIHFIEPQGAGEPAVLFRGYTSTAKGNWVAP